MFWRTKALDNVFRDGYVGVVVNSPLTGFSLSIAAVFGVHLMQVTLRHMVLFVVAVFLALTAGFCDSPTRSFGPRKPACWKPLVDTTGSAIVADRSPVWSPSGNLLVYKSFFDSCNSANEGIYVTDMVGVRKDKLDIDGNFFRWLPGDSELVVNVGDFFGGEIAKYNTSTATTTPMGINTFTLQFDVSKDGRYLFYDDGFIRRRDLQTGEDTALIEFGGHPAISPDGSLLVYAVGTINLLELGTGKIDTLAPKGTFPSWSPDGLFLVYYHPTKLEIHKVDLAGNTTVLARGIGAPTITPDGKQVYFPWTENNVMHIWRVNIDGTGLEQFTR